MEATTREQFGALTAREVAIFNRGAKFGYSQGYYMGARGQRAAA